MDKSISLCTASLALALALQPWHIATAASHCKGLTETVCGTTSACKWTQAREGAMNKSPRKAHCRLDVAAAAAIAAKITQSAK